ncbi:hypothetical protein MWK40_00015 [Escherichia coli]|nr:hypothetical protein [Escherichia coli]
MSRVSSRSARADALSLMQMFLCETACGAALSFMEREEWVKGIQRRSDILKFTQLLSVIDAISEAAG